jgi:hypothetical protein
VFVSIRSVHILIGVFYKIRCISSTRSILSIFQNNLIKYISVWHFFLRVDTYFAALILVAESALKEGHVPISRIRNGRPNS